MCTTYSRCQRARSSSRVTTRATTTYNPQGNAYNPLLGLLQLLGGSGTNVGGVNLPGIDPTLASLYGGMS